MNRIGEAARQRRIWEANEKLKLRAVNSPNCSIDCVSRGMILFENIIAKNIKIASQTTHVFNKRLKKVIRTSLSFRHLQDVSWFFFV